MKPFFCILLASLHFFPISTRAEASISRDNLKMLCPYQKGMAKTLFSEELLHEISSDSFDAIFESITKRNGPCLSFEWNEGEQLLTLLFRDVKIPMKFALKDKKVEKFAFGQAEYLSDSFEKIFSEYRQGGVYLSKDQKKIFAINETKPYFAGEVMRIALLSKLFKLVSAKKLSLQDKVQYSSKDKFFSNSITYNWNVPMSVSLEVLLNLVLYNEDEIATDLLILGLKSNQEFWRMRDMHWLLLKDSAEATSILKDKYWRDSLEKQKIIPELTSGPLSINLETAKKIGWKVNAKEICENINYLRSKIKLPIGDRFPGFENSYLMHGTFPYASAFVFSGQREGKSFCVASLLPIDEEPLGREESEDLLRRALKLLEK